jgi:hypothetical protein
MEYIKETPMNTNPVILKQMVDAYVETQNNELSTYTIDADIADSVDLLGKKASDLQENITIIDGKIYGTLKYVKGYEGFSGNPDEQQGHYLALHYECDGADAIKVNGVTLDSDGIHILIMKRKGGNIKVEVIKDNNSYVDYVNVDALTYK